MQDQPHNAPIQEWRATLNPNILKFKTAAELGMEVHLNSDACEAMAELLIDMCNCLDDACRTAEEEIETARREAFQVGWKINAAPAGEPHSQEYLDGCMDVDYQAYQNYLAGKHNMLGIPLPEREASALKR